MKINNYFEKTAETTKDKVYDQKRNDKKRINYAPIQQITPKKGRCKC